MIEQFHEDESWRDEIIDIDKLPVGYVDAYRSGPWNDCHAAFVDIKNIMATFEPSQEPIIVKIPDEHNKGHFKLWLYFLSDEN